MILGVFPPGKVGYASNQKSWCFFTLFHNLSLCYMLYFFKMGDSLNRERVPNRKQFILFSLGLVFLVFLGLFIYQTFLSPEAISNREDQEKLEMVMENLERYEEARRSDTYGGETPQETLDLFIEALEKGDVELASRYFSLDSVLTRKEWKEEISEKKQEILQSLKKATPVKDQEIKTNTFWFFFPRENTQDLLEMTYNEYSRIWKIEGM